MAWLSSIISSSVPTDIGVPRSSSTLVRSFCSCSSLGRCTSWLRINSSSMIKKSLMRSNFSKRSLHLLVGNTADANHTHTQNITNAIKLLVDFQLVFCANSPGMCVFLYLADFGQRGRSEERRVG